MPALRELEAQFLRWHREPSEEKDDQGRYVFRDDGEPSMWSPRPYRDLYAHVGTLAEAHGIRFLCPQSFVKNGGPKGTHSVYIFFEGSPVPPELGRNMAGEPVRWKVVGGSGYDDLQLSPSILEQGGDCQWHGFIGTSGVPPGHAA